MYEFAKKIEALKIMGGVMEGKTIDSSMVKRLSSIPSREVLLAKFMGSVQAPITGFVGTLHGVVAAFARVVKGYADQQASSAPAPVVVAEETPAPVASTPAAVPTAA